MTPINSLQNPFEIKPPEELSAGLICKLFVKEYTEHNALIGNYHTFIFGSRGSGKSMHFKYLEPKCQAIEYGEIGKFLKSESPFIGIYVNCNKGDFAKKDFVNLLADNKVSSPLVERMFTHYFAMDVAECCLKTFIEQLNDHFDSKVEEKVFNQITDWLGLDDIQEKTFNQLKSLFYNEKVKINSAIEEYYKNCGVDGNHLNVNNIKRFANVSLTDGSFLCILFNTLRTEVIKNEAIPYYLLFDEANELLDITKKIINTLISQRRHSLVSVKVSCQPLLYNIYVDLNDRPIQETHDYYLIELDSLYTTNKKSYYNRIKEIAERRLKIAGCKATDIMKFIPQNPAELEKIKQAEDFTAKEYDELSGKKPLRKGEYVRKYATARLFQRFLKKTTYGYAGFNNLVHFSSGIIRSFLEPCYSMLEEYIKTNPGEDIKEVEQIPFSIQKSVIENYSNLFVTNEIINPMRIEADGSKRKKILSGLNNLLESLGSTFTIRLKDQKSREPRIISFTIKESERDKLLQQILDYGVQKAFFHQKWYRAKSGHETQECYILNRRLCPRYHLDLSSFQGRVELSQHDLLIAIENPKQFRKKFGKEEENKVEQKQQLFDF